MLNRLIASVVAGAALAGCGTNLNQNYLAATDAVSMGAKAAHGHTFGFKFGAGRAMNPGHPLMYRGGDLPSQADIRSTCSPIADQGQLGSCTAFSMAKGLREYLENKAAQQNAQQPFGSFLNVNAAAKFTSLSALKFYYDERVIDGDVNEDAGSTMTTGMTVLTDTGVAPEADWPYDISKFTKKPSAKANKDAAQFKIKSKTPLNTLEDMKSVVAGGYPVVFGFLVYDNFMNIGSSGMMPMPTSHSSILGGHAVMVAGYDDAKKVLIMRNSWGTSWGDQGYFYMPYAYVTPDRVQDIWTGQ